MSRVGCGDVTAVMYELARLPRRTTRRPRVRRQTRISQARGSTQMNWTLVSRLIDRPTGGAGRGPAPGPRGARSDPVLRQASRSHLAPLPDRGPAQSAPASGHFRRVHLGGHQRRIALRTGRGGVAGGDRPEAVPTARRRRIASDHGCGRFGRARRIRCRGRSASGFRTDHHRDYEGAGQRAGRTHRGWATDRCAARVFGAPVSATTSESTAESDTPPDPADSAPVLSGRVCG